MQKFREKVTLTLSTLLYLLFNMRIGKNLSATVTATLWQIVLTVPYAIGCTIFITIFLQYMAGGEKLPLERKVRIFLGVGMVCALLMGIYEYGETVPQHQPQ